MVNVDLNNITINDTENEYINGNGDGILNAGETAIIQIPILNLGEEKNGFQLDDRDR